MEPHFGVNPHYYKPEGTTFCCKCGSLWFVVIWVHMTTNQREPHFGVHSYYYKPEGTTFWCKCGSFWFVVIWIHSKMWFPLICCNVDPYYYEPKGTTFTPKCGSLWLVVIWIHNEMWFLLVVMIWIHITTNQKEPHFDVNAYYYKPKVTTFCCKAILLQTSRNHILV